MGSDYNPILLSCGNCNFKKSYFKFVNWWLEVEGFKHKVKDWWSSFLNNGRPLYIFAKNFKLLKKELIQWSRSNRGVWKQRKEEILYRLGVLETIQEQKMLCEYDLVQKTHLAMKFEEVAKKEEIS